MPRVEWPVPQRKQDVIGDDLYDLWMEWNHQHHGDSDDSSPFHNQVDSFIVWLLNSMEGSIALRRINDFPRQLYLPFEDDCVPWRVVDDGTDGTEPDDDAGDEVAQGAGSPDP